MKQFSQERGHGKEQILAGREIPLTDKVTAAQTVWKIKRWASDEDRKTNAIYPTSRALALFRQEQFSVIPDNVLVNIGINELWTILCSSGGTKFDNANAQLLVGDDTTAEAATHTSLNAVKARPAWVASAAYALNAFVRPITVEDSNEFVYECTIAGTSSATEPAWPATNGAIVVDGTATWTARKRIEAAAMTVGFPTFGTNQQAVWKSRFDGTTANYLWREFAVRNGSTAMKMLNRRASAEGEKVEGHIWELELTITLS